MKIVEIKKIELTEEEKDILDKAADILKDINNEVTSRIDSYEDSEYVEHILDIAFEFWNNQQKER